MFTGGDSGLVRRAVDRASTMILAHLNVELAKGPEKNDFIIQSGKRNEYCSPAMTLNGRFLVLLTANGRCDFIRIWVKFRVDF